jgi:folate-binding Fe-S cluster repair protein YgfZ
MFINFLTLKKFSTNNNGISPEDSQKENLILKKYNAVFHLNNRSVVSVTGEDAENFIQSLTTNDIRLLKDDRVAQFTLFLNPKGKILFDTILVKSHL